MREFCWERSLENVETVSVAWAEERFKVAGFESDKSLNCRIL